MCKAECKDPVYKYGNDPNVKIVIYFYIPGVRMEVLANNGFSV